MRSSGNTLPATTALPEPHGTRPGTACPLRSTFHQRIVRLGDHLHRARRAPPRLVAPMSAGTAVSVIFALPSPAHVNAFMLHEVDHPAEVFLRADGQLIGNRPPGRTISEAIRGSGRGWRARDRDDLGRRDGGGPARRRSPRPFRSGPRPRRRRRQRRPRASATRIAARASLRKLAKPGVSIRLIFVLFHSAYASADDSVCFRAISSSSKSVTVVPSSTRPRRLTAPASKSIAEMS